mmetsp:Transcript_36053/g.119424  ORF Transcript_36053/g.119424 Transcript_36053/m.119424 type:complete len:439 (+) Transcript_36053:983-2299(+)
MDDDARSQSTTAAATSGARTMWDRVHQLQRDQKMRAFRAHTSRLRAACFSVLLQQQAAERAERADDASEGPHVRRWLSAQAGARALRRHESLRGPMLEGELLTKTFRVFDADGKGYISTADLDRVLRRFGQSSGSEQLLQGVTEGDREGQRITYGSFVRMMTHTVKQALDSGDYIYKPGDPVRYFYALLAGEVEVVQPREDGGEDVLTRLGAGEYFGENSLLEGRPTRSAAIRCRTPVEVLKLSKEDFEAGFGGHRAAGGPDQKRQKLIAFIQMVSRQQHRALEDGEPVFCAGDKADKFYILASGSLVVVEPPAEGAAGLEAHGGDTADASPSLASRRSSGNLPLGRIRAREGFGEMALLSKREVRSKTVRCASPRCEIVEIAGDDFCRLIAKSSVVRESFEWLSERRKRANESSGQTRVVRGQTVVRRRSSREPGQS